MNSKVEDDDGDDDYCIILYIHNSKKRAIDIVDTCILKDRKLGLASGNGWRKTLGAASKNSLQNRVYGWENRDLIQSSDMLNLPLMGISSTIHSILSITRPTERWFSAEKKTVLFDLERPVCIIQFRIECGHYAFSFTFL